MITPKEIQELATRKNVNRVAVENFLMTVGDDREIALHNLRFDTDLYGWNAATVTAISLGMYKHFNK